MGPLFVLYVSHAVLKSTLILSIFRLRRCNHHALCPHNSGLPPPISFFSGNYECYCLAGNETRLCTQELHNFVHPLTQFLFLRQFSPNKFHAVFPLPPIVQQGL